MFSLQTILGGKDRTFDLLQASAAAAVDAAGAANELTRHGNSTPFVARIVAARKREKELEAEISEELINTFVTALDREDVEAISSSLYKIPKSVEKFAERYVLVEERLHGIDFSQRTGILEVCTQTVEKMVTELHNGLRIDAIRRWQNRLQALEGEADKLMLEPYRDLYTDDSNPVRAMLARALFEILEQAIDDCRDVGNVIYSIVLKNS